MGNASERILEIDEECQGCGWGTLELTTSAEQDDDGWWAHDGDPVRCPDCGLGGMVSADAEMGYVVMEEGHAD